MSASGAGRARWTGLPGPAPRIGFGADYNPEQWTPDVWREDVDLMRAAGVNLVSVGIFSWAALQPAEGRWEPAWLHEVIDLLHGAGIAVDLATATASPPPWLTAKHPEILPVDRDGRTLSPGGRQHWRPTSPVFRAHALQLVERMAREFGDHPSVVLWHVNNELGCHVLHDYSDDAARAFRTWLHRRHGTVEALNRAWGTAFWSQRYSDFEEVLPPRRAAAPINPAQQLDFARFSSDALRDHLRAEVEVLREVTPSIPVTTNFVIMGGTNGMDYPGWVGEIDVVSNDHYIEVARANAWTELSFSASLTRGVAQGAPWLLMEHSTSAVNWQPVNIPKRPGQMLQDSITHLAHGADAICFFQWRQSVSGAEKFHSGMLPVGGTDTRVWREVAELGGFLSAAGELAGTRVESADVAVLLDWESWWAAELDNHPSNRILVKEIALRWYEAFQALGLAVDVVPTDADLSAHRLLVVPAMYVTRDDLAGRLTSFVEGGGTLVVGYFSDVVDPDDRIRSGGFLATLRDVLGVRVTEHRPLLPGVREKLDVGWSAREWTEDVSIDAGTEVVARFAEGDLDGGPAITIARRGAGNALYAAVELGEDTRALAARVAELAGARPIVAGLAEGVEVRRRVGDRGGYLVMINRTEVDAVLPASDGRRRIVASSQRSGTGPLVVPARGALVIAEH